VEDGKKTGAICTTPQIMARKSGASAEKMNADSKRSSYRKITSQGDETTERSATPKKMPQSNRKAGKSGLGDKLVSSGIRRSASDHKRRAGHSVLSKSSGLKSAKAGSGRMVRDIEKRFIIL
jgi:hypothetical protein